MANDKEEESILHMMSQAAQSMVPPDLRDKGWTYFDPPARFQPMTWDYFLALMGEGEYMLIAQSNGTDENGPYVRGQFFISPKAQSNLQDKDRQLRLAEKMGVKK